MENYDDNNKNKQPSLDDSLVKAKPIQDFNNFCRQTDRQLMILLQQQQLNTMTTCNKRQQQQLLFAVGCCTSHGMQYLLNPASHGMAKK